MELGEQIKKYRKEQGMSQDILAEKIYVTRQTVSNWETSKSYPDVNSLLRLSEVFGISVDALLKGDSQMIKDIVNQEDIAEFRKYDLVFTIMFILTLVLPIPLVHFLGFAGLAVWGIIAGITFALALIIEKKKKSLNIQTFREIQAFLDGKTLDEIEAAREEGKRPYQKILLAIACAVIALIVCVIMGLLFKL